VRKHAELSTCSSTNICKVCKVTLLCRAQHATSTAVNHSPNPLQPGPQHGD
jgi:hypothetical protein